MSEDIFIIKEPYFYLTKEPGKEVRVKLIEAFNVWTKLTESQLDSVKEIVQKLHNASLLIDDIEDNSKLRRGKPCAHLIFGNPSTINSANFVYFEALHAVHSLGSIKATSIFIDELLELHIGQGKDIYWREHNKCPSEEEYLVMVKQKTGGLFRLSIGLMQCLSNRKGEYSSFGTLVNDLSILFQILDDYLNLMSVKYQQNKSFCEDITEGKFSFPIIHHIQNSFGDKRVLNILSKRTEDVDLKKYALECMKETKSFDYTLSVLTKYYELVLKEIQALGGNQQLITIVEYLMKQIPDVH